MRLAVPVDERRNRVLRLADRKIDRGLARLDIGQELMQPYKRRAPLGLHRIGLAGIFLATRRWLRSLRAVCTRHGGAAEPPAA